MSMTYIVKFNWCYFCRQSQCHHIYESLVKIGCIIAEKERFFKCWPWPTFTRSADWIFLLLTAIPSLWSKFWSNWSKDSRNISKIVERYPYPYLDLWFQDHPNTFYLIAYFLIQTYTEKLKKIVAKCQRFSVR